MRVRITNEGSQTNLATCDLFPMAMMSFMSAVMFLYCWSHSWTPEDLLQPCSRQIFVLLFSLKKKKGIEDWAKFHVIMYMIILDFQGIFKYGWTSPQWPPWEQKKVVIAL